jgi:hypothetical protein
VQQPIILALHEHSQLLICTSKSVTQGRQIQGRARGRQVRKMQHCAATGCAHKLSRHRAATPAADAQDPLLLCRAAAARAPTYEQRAHLPRAAHALQPWLLVLVGGLLLLLGGAAGCAGGALILRGRWLSVLALVCCWAARGRRRGLCYSHMPLRLLLRGPAAPCRWLGSISSRLRGLIAPAQLVFIQHAIAVGTQQRGGLPAAPGRLDVARRWRARRLWGATALAASPTPAGAGS